MNRYGPRSTTGRSLGTTARTVHEARRLAITLRRSATAERAAVQPAAAISAGGGRRRSFRSRAGSVKRPTLTRAIHLKVDLPAWGAAGSRPRINRSFRAE